MMNEKGFTIIELLIATSIFSVLLLIALAGFAGVGNLFYKGVAITQTQSATESALKDMAGNIQTASAVQLPVNTSAAGNGYWYFCAGGVRYTYLLQHSPIDASQDENLSLGSSTNMALVKDILPSASSCAAPCVSACSVPFSPDAQELLSGRMRLMRLDIVGEGNQLYNINIVVAYGDDEDFDNLDNPDTIACKGGLSDQKFCAVDSLSTSVYEGLHS